MTQLPCRCSQRFLTQCRCLASRERKVIVIEAGLSFLGLGIQPPMASWGSLLAEGVNQINPIRIYWWLIVFPGGVLVSALLALNFVGDGLRDAWDVRSQA